MFHQQGMRYSFRVDGNSPETLETLAKRIEHLDLMLHEVHQFIAENRPHLDKALRFLDPGRAMKAYMANRPGRVPRETKKPDDDCGCT